VEWISRPFDPEAFDPGEVEDNLESQSLADIDEWM